MQFSSRASLLATFAIGTSAYSAPLGTFSVGHFIQGSPLVMGRMDPIINPGGPSGHVHAVQGGNGFALNMSNYQAVESSCTTSYLKGDKSNYWTPALYFQDPTTKKLEAVEFGYMNIYYFFDKNTADDIIIPFPPGLRMVTGNPNLRSPPTSGGALITDYADGPEINAVEWCCIRADESTALYEADSDGLHGYGIQNPADKGKGVGLSDKNCDGNGGGLRAEITMPSCWNSATDETLKSSDNPEGFKYLDTYTNKGTTAYPTKGVCPDGWAHLPRMFYEVYWSADKFASRWTPGQKTQPFVLANGDPTGYGLHADFFSGWDTEVLQSIISGCNTGDKAQDTCPGIKGTAEVQPDGTACIIENQVPEDIGKAGEQLDALPGNNPIGQWGVAPAALSVAGGSTLAPTASLISVTEAAISAPTGGPNSGSTAATSVANVVAPIVPSAVSSPTTSSGGTLTTLTTQTASASASASAGAPAVLTGDTEANTTSIDDWTYNGCFQDTNARVLTGVTFADVGLHSVTNAKCIPYCSARGFSMAGTEYGGQCFCGNALSLVTKLDDSKCAMPCEGDASEMCGGSMSLSVWTNSKPTVRREGRLKRRV